MKWERRGEGDRSAVRHVQVLVILSGPDTSVDVSNRLMRYCHNYPQDIWIPRTIFSPSLSLSLSVPLSPFQRWVCNYALLIALVYATVCGLCRLYICVCVSFWQCHLQMCHLILSPSSLAFSWIKYPCNRLAREIKKQFATLEKKHQHNWHDSKLKVLAKFMKKFQMKCAACFKAVFKLMFPRVVASTEALDSLAVHLEFVLNFFKQ